MKSNEEALQVIMEEIEKELGMMADYADKLEMLDYFEAEVGPNKTILND